MRILEHLADSAIRRRRVVILAVAALTLLAAYGATKVRLNADFSTYLDESTPLVQAYNYVGETFAGNSIGMVLVTAPDVFAPDVLGLMDRLTVAYGDVEGIEYVTSLTDVIDFKKTEWGLDVGPLISPGQLPRTRQAADSLKARVMEKDRFVGNLVSGDGTAAAIMLRFASSGPLRGVNQFATALRVSDLTEAVAPTDVLPEGTELYFGGMPFLIFNMTTLISGNMTVLVPLMIGVLLLVLFVGLRGWGGVVYPLTVVLISTVWTVGAMGFLGLRMDLLSGLMPVILIALGSADGIHYMKRYYEQRAAGESPAAAARGSYVEMGVPLAVTTLTTMIGFASLAISDFSVIRQFGLVTALGLFLALVVTLTLLPALASYGAGRPAAGVRAGGSGPRTVTVGVGRFVYRRRWVVLLGGTAALAVAAAGIPRIVKSVDWTLCLQRGSSPFHAEMLLREKFGGSLPVQVMVSGDLKDPATLSAMRALERRLDALPGVSKSQSIASVIAEMNDVMNNRYAVPVDRAGVSNLWFLIEDEEMMEQLVAKEDQEGLVQARLADWATGSIVEAVDNMRAYLGSVSSELAVLDLRAVPDGARDTLLTLRRGETAQLLEWDLAKRGVRVEAVRIEPVVAAHFNWEPGEEEYLNLNDALVDYLLSPESELVLAPSQARRLAAVVVAQWRDRGTAPAAVVASLAGQVVPGAEGWETEQLALSLGAVAGDVLGAARVAASMAKLEQLAPSLAEDGAMRRDVGGTLWEASAPLWAVEPTVADLVAGADGRAEVRRVPVDFARTGMASVLKEMEDELTPTQVQSLLTTLIFVIVLLALIFRSFWGAVLMVVPLLGTILINFGVMGYLGIGLDAFTAMVASIAIGLGIDYAIHFTHRYRRELSATGGDAATALKQTMATSGAAILVNSASVGLGFLVLLAAGGQHIRRFGGLTSLTMLVAGVLTLTLLPALFLWIRPKFLGMGPRPSTAAGEPGHAVAAPAGG